MDGMRRSSVCSLILMLLFPDQLNVIAMRQRRELSTQAALLWGFSRMREPWLSGAAGKRPRPRAGRRASVGDLENSGAPRGAPEFPRMHTGKEYL